MKPARRRTNAIDWNGPLAQLPRTGPVTRDAQRAALGAFRDGRTNLLVTTTLVEVGLDVREASVMIVLEAQRFGEGQLHQLRGRVGRGAASGLVLLVHGPSVSPTALARLASLAVESSGAAVARADLAARRPGERLGVEQSGAHDRKQPSERSSTPERAADPTALAKGVARLFVNDPHLVRPGAAGFARVVARVRRGLTFEAAG